jgi:hypothetical protein
MEGLCVTEVQPRSIAAKEFKKLTTEILTKIKE